MNLHYTDKKGILDILNTYRKNKEYQKGIETLKELLNTGEDIIYLEYLGEFYYLIGNYNEAEEYANKVLSKKSDSFYSLLLKAKLLMKKQKFQDALNILLSLEKMKNHIELYTYTGICYLKLKKFENAIEYLRKSIENGKPSGFVYYYLSDAYFNKKDFDNAIKYIQKAIDINNSQFYKTVLIKYKMEKLDINKRIEELKKILQIEGKKDIADLHIYLAENFLKNNSYDEAAEEFLYALKLNPGNKFYKERYIYACDKAGKYEITNKLLPELIKKEPFKVWLQVLYTRSCLKLKKTAEGLEFFYSLIKEKPKIKSIGRQIKKLKQFAVNK